MGLGQPLLTLSNKTSSRQIDRPTRSLYPPPPPRYRAWGGGRGVVLVISCPYALLSAHSARDMMPRAHCATVRGSTCIMRIGLLFKVALFGVLVALAIASIHIWLKEKSYLFSEEVISKLGKDALKKHGTAEAPVTSSLVLYSGLVPSNEARSIANRQARILKSPFSHSRLVSGTCS